MLFRRADRAKSAAQSQASAVKAAHVYPGRASREKHIASKSRARNDIMIGATGIALGLICALFPWYIFFNQDQFGPPRVTFAGAEVETGSDGASATPAMLRGESDVKIVGIPDLNLDYTPTGSLPPDLSAATPLPDQPYPVEATPFRVLHVTAGRAMIEDDSGIWVVQRGSTLPDRTRVDRIERQGDKWVVVTSERKVLTSVE